MWTTDERRRMDAAWASLLAILVKYECDDMTVRFTHTAFFTGAALALASVLRVADDPDGTDRVDALYAHIVAALGQTTTPHGTVQ